MGKVESKESLTLTQAPLSGQTLATTTAQQKNLRKLSPGETAFPVDAYHKHLYHLKGKKNIKVREVECKSASLNQGDSFVLDSNINLFVWIGSHSNLREQAKAIYFANIYREEECPIRNLHLMYASKEEDSPVHQQSRQFWEELGGRFKMSTEEDAGLDIEAELYWPDTNRLFKVTEIGDRLDVSAVDAELLSREMLDHNHCYVLDCHFVTYVWAGNSSTPNEKSWALLKAEELDAKRSVSGGIDWIIDGGERLIFREQFWDWVDLGWEDEYARQKKKQSLFNITFPFLSSSQQSSRNLRDEEERLIRESQALSDLIKEEDRQKQQQKTPAQAQAEEHALKKVQTEIRKERDRREEIQKEKDQRDNIEAAKMIEDQLAQYQRSQQLLRQSAKKSPSSPNINNNYNTNETSEKSPSVLQLTKQMEGGSAAPPLVRRNTVAGVVHPKDPKKEEERLKSLQEKEELAKELERLAKIKADTDEQLANTSEERKKKMEKEVLDRQARALDVRRKNESDREKREKSEWSQMQDQLRIAREAKEKAEREERERKEAIEREQREKEAKAKAEADAKARKEAEDRGEREKSQAVVEANETAVQKREREKRERDLREERELALRDERLAKAKADKEEAERAAQQEKDRKAKEREDLMAKLEAARKDREAKEREERLARRRAKEAPAQESAVDGFSPATPSLLKGPSRVAAPAGRRRATNQNPIRARAAIEQATEQAKSLALESASPHEKVRSSSKRAASAGAFGLLWAVGATAESFNKRRDDRGNVNVTAAPAGKGPRLYQVKGKRSPFVREVQLSWKCLNSGDVFVLDHPSTAVVYQWNGSESNRIERGKALDFVKKVKDKEHAGRSKMVVLEEKEKNEPSDFWTALGGKPNAPIPSAVLGGDDSSAEKQLKNFTKLYLVNVPLSLASIKKESDVPLDQILLDPIEDWPLLKECLEGTDSYVLDCLTEVYPWTGKKASVASKCAAVALATQISETRLKSNCWTAPIRREFDGAESVIFQEKFANWSSALPIAVQAQPTASSTSKTRIEANSIDVAKLLSAPVDRAEVYIDDGSGKPSVWRVSDFELVDVNISEYGQFYSGESYVVLYKYTLRMKDHYLIYFWQGRDSSINEKGSSALLTMKVDESIGGTAKEIRVVQNKEPKHFLAIFNRRIIVHFGKATPSSSVSASNPPPAASSSVPANINDNNLSTAALTGPWVLYQIGAWDQDKVDDNNNNNNNNNYNTTHTLNTIDEKRYLKVIQVPTCVDSLNSWWAYLLLPRDPNSKELPMAWHGSASIQEERDLARDLARDLPFLNGRKVKEFKEGSEPPEFWKSLGNSKPNPEKSYAISRRLLKRPLRLFQCSIGTGSFEISEIRPRFCQDDLAFDDTMILDAYDEIFVWLGRHSHESEKELAIAAALRFSEGISGGRPSNPPCFLVTDSKEPLIFISYFFGWIQLRPASLDTPLSLVADSHLDYTRKYSYPEIRAAVYPKSFDETRLEMYLSDEEFTRVFGMNLEAFGQLTSWKREEMRKALGLY